MYKPYNRTGTSPPPFPRLPSPSISPAGVLIDAPPRCRAHAQLRIRASPETRRRMPKETDPLLRSGRCPTACLLQDCNPCFLKKRRVRERVPGAACRCVCVCVCMYVRLFSQLPFPFSTQTPYRIGEIYPVFNNVCAPIFFLSTPILLFDANVLSYRRGLSSFLIGP